MDKINEILGENFIEEESYIIEEEIKDSIRKINRIITLKAGLKLSLLYLIFISVSLPLISIINRGFSTISFILLTSIYIILLSFHIFNFNRYMKIKENPSFSSFTLNRIIDNETLLLDIKSLFNNMTRLNEIVRIYGNINKITIESNKLIDKCLANKNRDINNIIVYFNKNKTINTDIFKLIKDEKYRIDINLNILSDIINKNNHIDADIDYYRKGIFMLSSDIFKLKDSFDNIEENKVDKLNKTNIKEMIYNLELINYNLDILIKNDNKEFTIKNFSSGLIDENIDKFISQLKSIKELLNDIKEEFYIMDFNKLNKINIIESKHSPINREIKDDIEFNNIINNMDNRD